jgi:6-phosphogluconolactonase
VFATPRHLAEAAADLFVAAAAAATRARGRFVVALAGGSTPNALYALLAAPDAARRVDWPRVEVFWGDERCVPPDDPASNYSSARERLLDRVPVDARRVHRMAGELDPLEAAVSYERVLRASFATPTGPPSTAPGARFDLVLLGMGGDGHTASLFPSTAAVGETERWVVAHQVDARPPWRITLTPRVFNAAAEVLFLVTGRDKAGAVERVLEGPFQPELLPSQAIAPRAGRLRFWIDAGAGSELSGS